MARILVIDDSRMMRLYLRRCLERAGYEVEDWVPLSAMEVAEHVAASAPDLIISDYQMPGCNGATVARMALRARPGLPILILTAFREAEMEAGLLKLGVGRVLAKPMDGTALVLAVEGALAAGTGITPGA